MKHALSIVIFSAMLTSMMTDGKADTNSALATDVTQSSSTEEITAQPKTPEASTDANVEDNAVKKPEPIQVFEIYLAVIVILSYLFFMLFDNLLFGICLGLLITNLLALIVSPFIWVIYNEIKLGLAMAIAGVIGISISVIGLYFIAKAES